SIDSVTQLPFSSWSDGGSLVHRVVPTTCTTYIANYATEYLLTQSFPNNAGEINPFSEWTIANSIVTCQAIPNSGFQFVNWTGDLSGNNNPTTLLMNGSKTVNANFSLISSGSFKIGGYCVRPDLSGNYYEVGSSPLQDESYSVALNGTLAYLADGTAGLRIIVVSNPA